jgi:hypothetical protein
MSVVTPGMVITFLVLLYGTGMLIYSGLLTWILNALSKGGQVTFRKTFLYCLIGAAIGTAISIVIYQIYEPTNIVYGQPDYRDKLNQQIELTNFCVFLPIGTILIMTIISFWTQMKNKNNP